MTLSPITQRRLAQFRANKRGYWSLWIFLALLAVCLFAGFIANDKPLLIKFDGAYYVPVFKAYPETTFGGDFETETEYRDPYVADLINAPEKGGGWMLWPPIRYSYDTINYNLPCPAPTPPPWTLNLNPDAPPSRLTACEKKIIDYVKLKEGESGKTHTGEDINPGGGIDETNGTTETIALNNWLGTDDQGRDVAARVIYGFRISVLFGLILTIISSIIGIAAGAVQGYYGGRLDMSMQRMIEVWSSLPSLYILIIFSAMFVPGFWTLLAILLLFSWVSLVDVVRAEFLRARNFDYVRAAHALGVSNIVIMWRHVLPNAMVATITFMPFILTGSITALTSLDFLGLGLPPGSPSLGELLAQGKNNLQAPWLGIAAFLSLAIMLSLLTFIGEAVRDAFDPRKMNL